MLTIFLFLIWSLVAHLGTAVPVAQSACQSLQDESLGDALLMPTDTGYEQASTDNWSATAWARPACIVKPASTEHVQVAIQILTKHNASFAIRSGGHSPSPLAANINGGILFDLSSLNRVDYEQASNVVTIGSGLTWGQVYRALDPYQVTVVGGRVLDVGVGGLILGSGLSYLSDLYGLACDNVVNFEVVLANGTSVNASMTSHQELWWALKGGLNNFGIITSFTLNTYPIHQVWGGVKMYDTEKLPELFAAVLEYQSNPAKDPYANFMLQSFPTNESIGVVLNMVYLKPEESPPAFAPFYSIPTIATTTKIQTLTEMISGQAVPLIPRWDWASTSFTPNAALYDKILSIVTTAPEKSIIQSVNSGTLAIGLQPISSSLVHAGNARGGNALGLSPINQTWFVLDTGWWNPSDDSTTHRATGSMINQIEQASKSSGNYVEYTFMNDASWDQDVIKHYGAKNVRRMKNVQRAYDPDLVFQKLVPGGFKLG